MKQISFTAHKESEIIETGILIVILVITRDKISVFTQQVSLDK